MEGKLYIVDAFTERLFRGNAAAVCVLPRRAEASWMQSLAAELNLSETSFVSAGDDGFDLRWFTPQAEVDLCGHATLAAATALWGEGFSPPAEPLVFRTRSGVLTCTRRGALVAMDFPATPAAKIRAPNNLLPALGLEGAAFVGRTSFDYLVVLDSGQAVRAVQPDFLALAEIASRGTIVTGPSDDPKFDFVSRFFAPSCGIDEDPVTGSAHCCLAPFWGERLGKQDLTGYQASRRGGTVGMEWRGDRVHLLGQAVMVARGELA